MPKADVAGLSMYYELAGEGTPVVFISGITADHAGWKLYQVPALTAAGFRCLVFDNRDVGQTGDSPVARYAIAQFAADTVALLDHLGLESVHLVGYSMGGMIAQEIALAHPTRLRTLTLMCSAAKVDAYTHSMFEAFAVARRKLAREEFFSAFALRVFGCEAYAAGVPRTWLERTLAHPHPQSDAAYLRQSEAILGHDALERVRAIRVPAHVVAGEEDIMLPPRYSRALARSIPGAKLTVIPGAGHAAHIEQPQAFNRAVLEFLQSHPAGAPGPASAHLSRPAR